MESIRCTILERVAFDRNRSAVPVGHDPLYIEWIEQIHAFDRNRSAVPVGHDPLYAPRDRLLTSPNPRQEDMICPDPR